MAGFVNGADPASVPLIRPEECLAIEDSKAGIQSAHRAGLKVVALARTYPAERLIEADCVLRNWGEVSFKRLEALFRSRAHPSFGYRPDPSGSDFSS